MTAPKPVATSVVLPEPTAMMAPGAMAAPKASETSRASARHLRRSKARAELATGSALRRAWRSLDGQVGTRRCSKRQNLHLRAR